MADNKFAKSHVSYTPKEKRIKNDDDEFGQQKITYDDTPLLFPAGLEKLFLLAYFIALPYVAGLIFLYFYVGGGKTELFLSISEESSFILTWAIGYEILASLLLLYIVKMAISFSVKNTRKGPNKKFRRP